MEDRKRNRLFSMGMLLRILGVVEGDRFFAGRRSLRWLALVLLAAVAASCTATERAVVEPVIDKTAETEAIQTERNGQSADERIIETARYDTALTETTKQVGEPAGEPGYAGYPYLGETALGDRAYFVSQSELDCTDAVDRLRCYRKFKVSFVEVDAEENMVQGQAVANCNDNALDEVIIDGDLAAYRMVPTDAAMTTLLEMMCDTSQYQEEPIGRAADEVPRGEALESADERAANLIPDMPPEVTYAEARVRLIEVGWIPKAVVMENYPALEKQFYEQGFEEILSCSGSGLCRFEFEHAEPEVLQDGKVLAVITQLEGTESYVREFSIDYSASLE